MCLDSITKKPKKHTVGYKIFKKNDDHFDGQVYETGPYYIGKTYDAKFGSEDLQYATLVNEPDDCLRKYPAGFHYYLKMRDAKRLTNSDEAVVRITVEEISATGIQRGCNAGVAEFMTLDRLVFDPEKDQMKQFLLLSKEKVPKQILKFVKDFQNNMKISTNELKKMANFVSQSDDDFINYICFVDSFPRRSKCFKILTKVHIWALNNHLEYKKYYNYVVKNVDELRNRFVRKNYYDMLWMSMKIDDFVLKM